MNSAGQTPISQRKSSHVPRLSDSTSFQQIDGQDHFNSDFTATGAKPSYISDISEESTPSHEQSTTRSNLPYFPRENITPKKCIATIDLSEKTNLRITYFGSGEILHEGKHKKSTGNASINLHQNFIPVLSDSAIMGNKTISLFRNDSKKNTINSVSNDEELIQLEPLTSTAPLLPALHGDKALSEAGVVDLCKRLFQIAKDNTWNIGFAITALSLMAAVIYIVVNIFTTRSNPTSCQTNSDLRTYEDSLEKDFASAVSGNIWELVSNIVENFKTFNTQNNQVNTEAVTGIQFGAKQAIEWCNNTFANGQIPKKS